MSRECMDSETSFNLWSLHRTLWIFGRSHGFKEYDFQIGISMEFIIWINSYSLGYESVIENKHFNA